ncbi:MAG: lytic transglycosylase domain-containing protein, partial [Burkholderiales bacterium]|nr:lytic transglycosylase domain-containing protein [Burkholderiales bacterium]
MKKSLAGLSLMILAGFATSPFAYAAPAKRSLIANDDDRFMALRDAAMHDDAASVEQYAAMLKNYAIPSYIDYYRIRSRLVKTSNSEFREFISKYEGSAIADRLRNDWLLLLGRRGEWDLFDQQYPQFVVADDNQLRCYSQLSKAMKQQKVATEARNLLNSPRDYGEGCYALVTYLATTGQFNQYDLWAQMRMAAESGATPLAQRLGKLLNVPEKQVAEVIDKPAGLLKKAPDAGHAAHELYLIALGRLAKTDHEQAAATLSRHAALFTDNERALGWAQIAMQAALKLEPEALGYWQK